MLKPLSLVQEFFFFAREKRGDTNNIDISVLVSLKKLQVILSLSFWKIQSELTQRNPPKFHVLGEGAARLLLHCSENKVEAIK